MMNEVQRIAKICYEHCDEAVGIIEFLEAGNTPEVEASYCGDPYVANIIRNAMKQRLVMSIMRMHDGAGQDRETLLKAFSLMLWCRTRTRLLGKRRCSPSASVARHRMSRNERRGRLVR